MIAFGAFIGKASPTQVMPARSRTPARPRLGKQFLPCVSQSAKNLANAATEAIQCHAVQVLWLSVVMIPLYALNQQLVFGSFKALDVGGSISIHAFGAYYGLAASLVLSRCNGLDTKKAIGHDRLQHPARILPRRQNSACTFEVRCLRGRLVFACCAAVGRGRQTSRGYMVPCRGQEQYTSIHPKNSGSYTR